MEAAGSHKEYYEISSFWDKNFMENTEESIRINEIINSIPEDVEKILEIGCGNGAIINNLHRLGKYKRTVGVDISDTALKYVQTEKYISNVNDLPFEDNSFDCVIASEVIEHLTFGDYKKGLSEIERVTKKYIIITVPNQDNLELDLRMCNHCYCWFNPVYHLNSFDTKSLKELFGNQKCRIVKAIGPEITRSEQQEIAKLILHYKKKHIPSSGICPQCGFNFTANNSLIITKKKSTFKKKLNTSFEIITRLLFTKKIHKKRWLYALYEKQN